MWEKLNEVKKWVVEKVLWAEKELRGKTGAEKRAAVVAKLNEIIDLPWVPEWVEEKVIGWMVDLACEKLNWLFGHGGWDAELTDVQQDELAEALTASIDTNADVSALTVDERLGKLCQEYGIEWVPQTEPVKGGDLTEHFRRSEFACKCGCGFDDIDPKLVAICERVRQAVGVPVRVNSGCRCEKYNAKVKGAAKDSQHTKGKAADLSCSIGAMALYDTIQALYAAGELPGLEYCLRYPTFVHVDIGKPRSQRFAVKV